jgi:FG-GAP-like repeat
MCYSTMDENKNLSITISYWLEWMQKLKMNEATGIYGFQDVDESKLDDFDKGKLAYHRGQFAQAVSLIEQDVNKAGESENKLFWLAMCYIRRAEVENCLPKLIDAAESTGLPANHDHNAHADHTQICALPLTQFHDRADSSRAAARLFESLLDRYDHANRLYQWLLNFCYMTIDAFPQEVPPKYLIQTEFIDSFYGAHKSEIEKQYSYLMFEDRAKELGVDTYNTGRGVAVEDFDNDGYLDIVTGGSFDVVKYYKNDHGRGFIDKTEEVGLGGIKQPFVITCADYDNDGWVDIFFGRPFGSYSLYRNNRDGTFTDVTASSGLNAGKADDEINATWVSAWADVNGDGYLDLFVAQWGFKIPFVSGLMAKPRIDSKLFINQNGHFVDKTEEFGLSDIVEDQYFIGAAFGDYNSDGYPDLFLSSPLRNTSVLLKNISGNRFEKTNLIDATGVGFSAAFVDINHDGRLDIFQAGFADAKSSTEQAVFRENVNRYHSGHSTIFLQTPDGKFERRDDFFDMPMSTMGASFGDINNDGCYDFYLGTGDPEGWFILPNLMYLGETQGTGCAEHLTNISMLNGFGTIQKGHGIVFFDFDNDGRQDVYSSLGGMWPADAWPNQFFVNKSNLKNSWVKIRLRGRKTNHFGVGATIKVVAENQKHDEIVRYYLMDQKTGFGSGPYLAHIGLMNATQINGVEVYWPASGCRKTYRAELGKLNTLDEQDCF